MKNYKKLCGDCASLVEKNGVWCCDECFGQKCEDLDECPEGVEVEEIAEIEKTAKENKPKGRAVSDEKKKERKPREKKIDEDKVELITRIRNCLNIYTTEDGGISDLTILNPQKEITFVYNNENYSISLIKHRTKK